MANNSNSMNGFFRFSEPVRAAFLNVIKPTAAKLPNGRIADPNYNATFLLDLSGADLKALKAKMVSIARAKWPTKALTDILFPLKDGAKMAQKAADKGKDGSFYVGHVVLSAKTGVQYAPRLGVLENGRLIALDTDILKAQYQGKFYHGCYVVPQISLVAGDGNGSNIPDYVTAYLQMVVWVKDGPRIGGPDMAEVYKDYIGRSTPEVDPTGGSMDDEIPF